MYKVARSCHCVISAAASDIDCDGTISSCVCDGNYAVGDFLCFWIRTHAGNGVNVLILGSYCVCVCGCMFVGVHIVCVCVGGLVCANEKMIEIWCFVETKKTHTQTSNNYPWFLFNLVFVKLI